MPYQAAVPDYYAAEELSRAHERKERGSSHGAGADRSAVESVFANADSFLMRHDCADWPDLSADDRSAVSTGTDAFVYAQGDVYWVVFSRRVQ